VGQDESSKILEEKLMKLQHTINNEGAKWHIHFSMSI